jgi:hypothetical protein
LSGQAVATSSGSLGLEVAVALSGSTATASDGSLILEIAVDLSGQHASGEAGDLSPAVGSVVEIGLDGTVVSVTAGNPGATAESASQFNPVGPGVLDFMFGVDLALRQKHKEDDDLKATQEAQRQITNPVDFEIAQFLHEQEVKDAQRADLQRLQVLADSYRGRAVDAPDIVQRAVERAQLDRSFNALQALQRVTERAMQEEELAIMLIFNQ